MTKELYKKPLLTFIIAFTSGIVIHLFALTNNLALHDNVYNLYWGGTYTSGRWGLFLIERLSSMLTGVWYHVATPDFHGVLSILFVAFSAAVLVYTFEPKHSVTCGLIGILMVAFPVITATLGFMFTSAAYMFGLLCSVLGAAIIIKHRKFFFVGAGFLILSTGIYQAYLPFAATLLLADLLRKFKDPEEKVSKTLKLAGFYLCNGVFTVVIYWLLANLTVKFKNTELSDYQGIGNAASAGFGSYIKQVGTAYREFFSPSPWEPTTMYFGFGRIIYYACILLFLIFTIRITAGIVLSAEKNIARAILFPVFSMLFPLAANSIFVLCASSPDTIHSLMMYGEVGFFLWLLLLSDESFAQGSTKKKSVNGDSIAALCGCVLIASLTVSDWYVAGVCYHKADYAIKSSSAFLNRMVMRFETTPGYSEAKGIVFVGRPQPSPTNYAYGEFDNLIGTYPYGLVPYNYLAPVFDYNWKEFLKSEVGFGLPEYDISEIDQSLLNGLNIYPEEGSVAVKDGLILIRFE